MSSLVSSLIAVTSLKRLKATFEGDSFAGAAASEGCGSAASAGATLGAPASAMGPDPTEREGQSPHSGRSENSKTRSSDLDPMSSEAGRDPKPLDGTQPQRQNAPFPLKAESNQDQGGG
eukprot:8238676-Pyramimonas_sp.AAC.1